MIFFFNYDDGTTDTVEFIVPSGEDEKDGEIISICEAFDLLPESLTMRSTPKMIMKVDDECKVVTMPTRGLLSDLRVEGGFSGSALKKKN